MRKLMLACCLGAIVATPALAKGMDPEDKAEYLQKVLQLNDQQTQQIQQTVEQSYKQKEALADKYKISQYDDYMDEKKKIKSNMHDSIAKILNPQQQEAFKAMTEMKKEKRNMMHKKMKDMHD